MVWQLFGVLCTPQFLESVSPLDGINKDVGGAKLRTADDHLCLPCGLYMYLSLTEDTALLSVS